MLVFDEAAILQPALAVDDVQRGLVTLGWDGSHDEAAVVGALHMLTGWGSSKRRRMMRRATPRRRTSNGAISAGP